jgi:hypothetical protein
VRQCFSAYTPHGWCLREPCSDFENYTANYYFGEKSSFWHTFLIMCPEFMKIKVKFKNSLLPMLQMFEKVNMNL